MQVVLDQFAPDADQTVKGALVDMVSMVPSFKGYKAAPTATDPGYDALASACFGAVVTRKLDNTTRFIAGLATKLYEISGASWVDVTRAVGGAYGATIDIQWSFAQFGNVTLAANKADTLQYSESSNFANITSGPKAKLVETVNQFVFVADMNGPTFSSEDQWQCCAIGDYTDWTPDTATQCVSGRLTSAPGRITALKRLGDAIVAYKDRSMFVGSYVGAPEAWTFQEIPGSVGTPAQGSVVDIGSAHIFMGYDNFYIFDGSRPTPIGNPIKDWFLTRLYTDYTFRIKSVHDRKNSNVYFFYPSTSGAGTLDSCIVYNYRVNKWGVDNRTVEAVVDFVSAGITFASSFSTGNTFATVDAGLTYDSPLLVAGQPAPAYINTSHDVMLLTGAGDTWSFTTNDFGDDNAVSTLTRVKPRFLTAPTTATMVNYYRMVQGANASTGATTTYKAGTGAFDVLRASRWHKLQISGTGGCELGAIDVQFAGSGNE